MWLEKVVRSNNTYTSIDWDDPLPEKIPAHWSQVIGELPNIDKIKIPRWLSYTFDTIQSIQLHSFCDGSNAAYAASIHLRIQFKNHHIVTHLLVSKRRVTSTKPLTIPLVGLCENHIGKMGSFKP